MEGRIIVKSTETSRDDNGYIYYRGELFSGVEQWFYDDGTLGSETEYLDGIADGCGKWWYKNGQLGGEKFYKKGRVDGMVKEWFEDGRLKSAKEIHAGKSM
ncbi:MAG: hypothetical protein LBK58_07150 [Prevotellaceae bacterium]|jgi:antitoxin component YwqK of YwqJK toxin-antitoxin module|nr:hypothetical protein [Prevotellaceae bacterium]